ncbi:NAD-dependent epimerase/dehydratase family protein [Aliarcobacter butzleri]|uniref:NAD-dependent epimerase/dehydratase family protein n=1 Tax=Aliarcobacter butzleri TaxID=28197 RepID=UPI001EDA3343|nr:NAD-dependent epimerase/dehydratase family protein [Aliarcobacter butzleri]MCG3654149.1 NAD-dependent epimerase/dehydratase family protein [Aliarcobacter butzleri]MDN5086617.1 NAD-dependent epimerase/dehydratase family protein [Aliarcobacter butzleri]
MNKLLVTGSNGYVGKNFINKYNNQYLFEKFSLLNQNIEDINFNRIDVLLHCAALVHQKEEHSYEKYYEANVEYPVKLAKLAKQNGVKQFVFISTIAVYGEEKEKLNENTICNPATFYGKSKLEAEKELLKLNDDSFTVSIIRPPMIYGKSAPGNIDSLVKLVKKLAIIPLGNIENKRSFISIQNLCHLVDEIITQEKQGIFLASDDKSLSTSKLIELIAKNLDKKIYLIKIPFFETLLKILKPSFHKRLYGSLEIDNIITKEKLNLKNLYSVEDGIRLMIRGEKI